MSLERTRGKLEEKYIEESTIYHIIIILLLLSSFGGRKHSTNCTVLYDILLLFEIIFHNLLERIEIIIISRTKYM